MGPPRLAAPAVAMRMSKDATKGYLAALPGLSYDLLGFVNDENASALSSLPVVEVNATAASPAGSYPITVSGGSAANYQLSYQTNVSNNSQFQNNIQFLLASPNHILSVIRDVEPLQISLFVKNCLQILPSQVV